MGGVKEKFSNWYCQPLFIVFNLMHVKELNLFQLFFFWVPQPMDKSHVLNKNRANAWKGQGFWWP
jgi:hypothetical protein